MKYGNTKQLNTLFKDALLRTKEILKKEGFGILTEIDVKKTLKEKLDVDHDNYVILGACNPPLSYEALQIEKEIGLLLPCNVIVYELDKKVFVSATVPSVTMGMVENEKLAHVAQIVEEMLIRVIDEI
ncbi:MAG: DUF302 domain-containing protein [Candidatus Magasanikbacteria bacterium]